MFRVLFIEIIFVLENSFRNAQAYVIQTLVIGFLSYVI